MKIRLALVSLVLALVAVTAAEAQGPGAGAGPDRRVQMMFKDITLTAAQQTKVDSILAAYRTRMPPMQQGTRPDSATMATRRELMQKQQADLRTVLTKEQQPVFDRNVEELRGRGRRPN